MIWQLTSNRLESKHSYYDICPWNADERYILFSSADPADLTTSRRSGLSTQTGLTCIMDTRTFELTVIGEGGFYTAHTGTLALWHPVKNIAYYRLGPEKIGALDVDSGKRFAIKGVLRQLSPDGRKFASQLNPADRPNEPEAWGFYTMNADGSGARCIISTQELYELTPNKDQFRWDQMTVGNPKWSPGGGHLLITMWVHPRSGVRRSLYIADRTGSKVRWLTYFGHHHSWMPDGKGVLFNGWKTITPDGKRKDPRMFVIDFDGSNRRVVIDKPVGSHPCVDPSGGRIADSDADGVFVVHVTEQRIERVATFRKRFDMSHKGTHPHCVWNRKGTHVLYNSAETGHGELYLVSVDS